MSSSNRARLVVDGIGLTAVVASLVFVGLEVRQNTAATRSATQQGIFDAGTQLQINMMNNDRLRELIVTARADPGWLSEAAASADYLLLSRFHEARFSFMENAYYHHSQGTLEPDVWAGYDSWIRSATSDSNLDRHFWGELRQSYFPTFRQYMDSVLEVASGL